MAMSADPTVHAPPELIALKARIDGTLDVFLSGARAEMATVAADALLPIDEVIRLTSAGGKRLRPMFCYWGFRAAGGVDGEPIERAAAALELLHTMALIHDDLMDRSPERRGAPASARQLADRARHRGSLGPRARRRVPGAAGRRSRHGPRRSTAPDLGVHAGSPGRRARSLPPDAHRDGARAGARRGRRRPPTRSLASRLKGGSYTVDGPLLVGAALAGGDPAVDGRVDRLRAPARSGVPAPG